MRADSPGPPGCRDCPFSGMCCFIKSRYPRLELAPLRTRYVVGREHERRAGALAGARSAGLMRCMAVTVEPGCDSTRDGQGRLMTERGCDPTREPRQRSPALSAGPRGWQNASCPSGSNRRTPKPSEPPHRIAPKPLDGEDLDDGTGPDSEKPGPASPGPSAHHQRAPCWHSLGDPHLWPVGR